MAIHGVVRTDNMGGTDVRAALVSIQYLGADGSTPTDIDNGNVLKVGALMDGEREQFVGSAVAADDSLENIVLIASPEIMYYAPEHELRAFYNKAGKPCRGYRIHNGDIFSVTAEALSTSLTEMEPGNIVELAAGTKLSVVASATSGSTAVGKIIAVDTVGKNTYYVILVG